MNAELEQLIRDFDNGGFRVDTILKDSVSERTERVYWTRAGSEQGPILRKTIKLDSGMGNAYEGIFKAQNEGKLLHYLPRILGCEHEEDSLVVYMEYIPGSTLEDGVRHASNRHYGTCRYFPLICEAVSELHESLAKPLIHRDLKPSNIIITWDSVYLIDLSIARSFSEGAESDTRQFGTRTYAPPEQFGYGQTDVRSDVYALGMVLYFMITGKNPHAGLISEGFAQNDIPASLQNVLAKATAFDPANRYASAAKLREAFIQATALEFDADIASQTNSGDSAMSEPLNQAPNTAVQAQVAATPKAPDTKSQTQAAAVSKAPDTKSQAQVATAPKASNVSSILSRIPRKLGLVWNIVLSIYVVLLLIGCCACAFDPSTTPAYSSQPFVLRFIACNLSGLIATVPTFILCDRRPLYKRFPELQSISILKQSLIVIAITFCIFIVLGIFSFLTNSY